MTSPVKSSSSETPQSANLSISFMGTDGSLDGSALVSVRHLESSSMVSACLVTGSRVGGRAVSIGSKGGGGVGGRLSCL